MTLPSWSKSPSLPREDVSSISSSLSDALPKADRRIFAHSFQPAASPKALTRISRDIRSCALHHRSDKSLTELARMYNPCIRGWITYYSHFYRSCVRP
jgi:hypothetical protein